MPRQGSGSTCPAAIAQRWTEIILLAVLTGLLVWKWPPDVNEAYYLCKSRHYWNPGWCQGDLFIASHATHWFFHATTGWLTSCLAMDVTAWIGRGVAWLVTSWGLVRLWRVFDERPWQSLLFVPLAILLNRNFHLAGEWFCGGFEAKALAWGFIFAGVAASIGRRYRWATIWLAAATAFHVVLGLWTIIAIGISVIVWRIDSKNIGASDELGKSAKANVPATIATTVLALALFAAGLLPALERNLLAPRELILEAGQIQAFSRLAHHQDAMQFDAERWIAFLTMTAAWAILGCAIRRHPTRAESYFSLFAFSALLINVSGLMLSEIAGANPESRPAIGQLLSLYWFRLADVVIPLALVVNASTLARQTGFRLVVTLAGSVIIAAIGWNLWSNVADPRSGAARQSSPLPATRRAIESERNWRLTCEWIRSNAPADSVWITPADQQTFKWYAGRAEVANWKDMPQDAARVVEWNDRIDELYRMVPQTAFGVLGLHDHVILNLAAKYGATHLVVERRFVENRENIGYPPAFRRVWPVEENSGTTFILFELKVAESARMK